MLCNMVVWMNEMKNTSFSCYAFLLYLAITKWRSFIVIKINYYLLKTLEITKSIRNWTKSTSVGPPPITGRPSNGERLVIAGFIVVRRSPQGVHTIAAGTPAGHRPKIWSFEKKIGQRPNSLPAAIFRWPLGGLRHCSRSRKLANVPPI